MHHASYGSGSACLCHWETWGRQLKTFLQTWDTKCLLVNPPPYLAQSVRAAAKQVSLCQKKKVGYSRKHWVWTEQTRGEGKIKGYIHESEGNPDYWGFQLQKAKPRTTCWEVVDALPPEVFKATLDGVMSQFLRTTTQVRRFQGQD